MRECVTRSRCLGNRLQRPSPLFQQDPPTERACPSNGWKKVFMGVFSHPDSHRVCVFNAELKLLQQKHFENRIEKKNTLRVSFSVINGLLLSCVVCIRVWHIHYHMRFYVHINSATKPRFSYSGAALHNTWLSNWKVLKQKRAVYYAWLEDFFTYQSSWTMSLNMRVLYCNAP